MSILQCRFWRDNHPRVQPIADGAQDGAGGEGRPQEELFESRS